MRRMIIDEKVRADALRIGEYARMNQITRAEMEDRVYHPEKFKPLGEEPNRTMEIPMGFLVSYTEEEQPFGMAKHLSVSVIDKDVKRLPNQAAVQEVMNLFGMRLKLGDPEVLEYLEDMGPERPRAVNVIVTVDPEVKLRGR